MLNSIITQWRETDLQFIQRLLVEVGIWYHSEMQAATEQEKLLFADHPLHYQFDVHCPTVSLRACTMVRKNRCGAYMQQRGDHG